MTKFLDRYLSSFENEIKQKQQKEQQHHCHNAADVKSTRSTVNNKCSQSNAEELPILERLRYRT